MTKVKCLGRTYEDDISRCLFVDKTGFCTKEEITLTESWDEWGPNQICMIDESRFTNTGNLTKKAKEMGWVK